MSGIWAFGESEDKLPQGGGGISSGGGSLQDVYGCWDTSSVLNVVLILF